MHAELKCNVLKFWRPGPKGRKMAAKKVGVFFVTGTMNSLPAALRRAQRAGIQLPQIPILRFFAPQGCHVEPMGVKFGTEEVPSPLPNFTPIGATIRV